MPGLTLGIGETNPKRGAVQWDARRIDGVQFIIPEAATVESAPIGSVVTLQENADGKQRIVLGAAAYEDDEYDLYAIIAVGFLEAATQTNNQIDQSIGEYADGDFACMISDPAAVAASPLKTSEEPDAGAAAYITPDGTISNSSSGNVAFPGEVFYGVPGVQNSGQLKSGYIFARLKSVTIG
ncbi:MAG: hypothetical protein JXN64_06335 [Spirochaetes bacterium]|nr:hypothetical protein [Spirochaetota bacterium]